MKISAPTLEKMLVKILTPARGEMLVKISAPTRGEMRTPTEEEILIEIWAAAAASMRRAPAVKAICVALCHHR
jgi:hypothetical protein